MRVRRCLVKPLLGLLAFAMFQMGGAAATGVAMAAVPVKRPVVPAKVLPRTPIAKPKLVLRPLIKPIARPVIARQPYHPPPLSRPQIVRRLATLPHTAFRAPVVVPLRPLKSAKPAVAAPTAPKLVSLTPPAAPPLPQTEKPVLLAQKSDWSVFRASAGTSRTCFAATRPKDSEPRLGSRNPVTLYLTSYYSDGIKNELTVKMGWQTPAGSTVTAMIAGREYPLSAGRDLAYPPTGRVQRDLLQAMRNGNMLLLRTASKTDGAVIVRDSFSLLGLAEALRVTETACADPVTAH